jgi:hypothetical protein
LDPADNCSLFAQDNLWVSMSSSSLLHLAARSRCDGDFTDQQSSQLPLSVYCCADLEVNHFCLAADAPESWAAAAKIAGDLGTGHPARLLS